MANALEDNVWSSALIFGSPGSLVTWCTHVRSILDESHLIYLEMIPRRTGLEGVCSLRKLSIGHIW
jgi:hypothetical protein